MAVIVAIISMLILWKLVVSALKTSTVDDAVSIKNVGAHVRKRNKNYGDYRSADDDMVIDPAYSSWSGNIYHD